VLSGRGLCDGLITRPEESYRLWRVVVCDQDTSKTRRLKSATGLWKMQTQWVVTPKKQSEKSECDGRNGVLWSWFWIIQDRWQVWNHRMNMGKLQLQLRRLIDRTRATKVKIKQPVTGLEWPRGFQEFKVPRFHENCTGWW